MHPHKLICLLTVLMCCLTGCESDGPFPIVGNGASVPLIYDRQDAEVVGAACEALAGDIELITGVRPKLSTEPTGPLAIIAGTLGKSRIIDQMVESGKLSTEELNGKWETFSLNVIECPMKGLERALVIAGSDPRGTAFGVFELSKRLGVSPWVWWADVIPAKRTNLSVDLKNTVVTGPPSVKYRGIFLNDEDWCLKRWAEHNIDTDIKDIGPKTYAHIFELLLRLKANYIWPAMHPCTRAFFSYDGNFEVAKKYSIVIGSSHCEPMLRNNVDEWKYNYDKEYGKKPGPWRYDTNRDEIWNYWNDRAGQIRDRNIEGVFTVGMRGIHDGDMPGPKSQEGKIALLNKVMRDQREILSRQLGKNADEIPQIFCPYKEVLKLYQAGARIPDDVTLVWADDNHGYIRKLSNPEEQKRSGRSGVYYHLSYWGAPEDYLWLSSTSPALISYEMTKAYEFGADRLWVFNVGDLKPAELETEFAMDLAWNVHQLPPEKSLAYIKSWAAQTFGPEVADEIAEIKTIYYRLAAAGKPEHLNRVSFTPSRIETRLAECRELIRKTEALKERIPERLQDAWFQLVLYPTLGAAYMNEKHLYATQGDLNRSTQAYEKIVSLTKEYNDGIADKKWKYMMCMNPREREVFKKLDSASIGPKNSKKPLKTIAVSELNFDTGKLHIIPGLGITGESLSRLAFNAKSYSAEEAGKAPAASIQLNLSKGSHLIELICVPTHAIHKGRGLRTAIRIGDSNPKIVDVQTPSKTAVWTRNVLRGYSRGDAVFDVKKDGPVTVTFALLDPGLAISEIHIY